MKIFQVRPGSYNTLLRGKRLSQQFWTDQQAKVERARLNWVKLNQKTLRADRYQGLVDAKDNGDLASSGNRIILAPSITGSPRWYVERTQDALALVARRGKPTLFITVTCNIKWPEIQESLYPGETAFDRPDICARVFKRKIELLLDLIVDKKIFGGVVWWVYTIEWQKRKGLPHMHLLVTLEDVPKSPREVDELVSAEIPDPSNTRLYKAVLDHMIHGPCGLLHPNSPCMQSIGESTVKICKKDFPKEFAKETKLVDMAFPVYRRRQKEDGGREAVIGKHMDTVVDNRWVVPYNPYLLLKLDCHVNVILVTSGPLSPKYLYKYQFKGPDRVLMRVQGQQTDEVEEFVTGRYISASESVWKLQDIPIHGR